MGVADVAAALREVLDTGERVRASILVVIERLSAARDRIAQVTVGSAHPLTRQAVNLNGHAIDRAAQALADLEAAERAITDYLSAILGSSGFAPPSTTDLPTAVPMADAADFDPAPCLRQMPRFVRDARVRPKAHGRWIDRSGVTHHLLSGRHDGYHAAVDRRAVALGLVPARAGLGRSGDVELKFAMRMRESWRRTGVAPRETIVINNRTVPAMVILAVTCYFHSFSRPVVN